MYFEAGRIVTSHGIKGEVRAQSYCDSVEILASHKVLFFDEGKNKIDVKSRVHKNVVIMEIEGIDTIDLAQKLVGKTLFLAREDFVLDDGQYFIQDLIGIKVCDADTGEEYGTIFDVIKTGANDVYCVKTAKGEVLVPVIPHVVLNVDLKVGKAFIRPLEGLFDDEN